ncbi:MAG: acetate--CoA ligase family protein [Acidimicrobiales bacterium]
MTRTLSEHDSKALLAEHGVPMPAERLASTPDEARAAVDAIGLPAVAKLCGDGIAHKTERGLVRLDLATADAVAEAAGELLANATADDGDVQVLVAPMLRSNRELIAGLALDPQFGMTVLLGVGGILAEAIEDVVIRLVPIERADAYDMIDDLRTQKLLGAFRGEPAVDRDAGGPAVLAERCGGRPSTGWCRSTSTRRSWSTAHRCRSMLVEVQA